MNRSLFRYIWCGFVDSINAFNFTLKSKHNLWCCKFWAKYLCRSTVELFISNMKDTSFTFSLFGTCLKMGSGCGTVDRVGASDTSRPGIESSHYKILCEPTALNAHLLVRESITVYQQLVSSLTSTKQQNMSLFVYR